MRKLVPWLAAIASGIALALALPGLNWAPLALLFPGLLLAALDNGPRWWKAVLLGWLAGTCHWAIATAWVLPVMHHYGGLPLAAAVVCAVLMAAYLGLTWAATAVLTASVSPALRVWLLPVVWSALEASRQHLPYIFPWNPTAAGLVPWPATLASLPVWGATGVGWALTTAGTALWGLTRRDTRPSGTAALVAAVGITIIFTTLSPAPRPAGAAIRVAVLQPGTSLEQTWDPNNWQGIANRVWALTREAADHGTDLVLWPESAMPFKIDWDPEYRRMLIRAAGELDTTILINSVGAVDGGGYANSAYLVQGSGVAEQRYDKVRLVPYGEYVPWVARFAFARSLVREVAQFTPGTSLAPLPARVPIGVAICYEIVFADLVAEQVRLGAQVLTTITNDGWYGYSWAPDQHFAQAVLRAIETRRWVARAALTGISGFVDPHGRVGQRLEVGAMGLAVAEVVPMRGITPRVGLGDWWALLCAIAAAAILGIVHLGPWFARSWRKCTT